MVEQQPVDLRGAVNRDAVARIGQLDVGGAGDGVGECPIGGWLRDPVLARGDDQGWNARQLSQPRARIVLRHRAQLLHDDRRLLREVVAEQGMQPAGELDAIDPAQIAVRHDQAEERIAPHGARADAHAHRRRQQRQRHFRAVAAAGERAEKRQAQHALGRRQRHGLGDDAAHRMPGDVEAREPETVHDRERVGGHVLDRQPAVEDPALRPCRGCRTRRPNSAPQVLRPAAATRCRPRRHPGSSAAADRCRHGCRRATRPWYR